MDKLFIAGIAFFLFFIVFGTPQCTERLLDAAESVQSALETAQEHAARLEERTRPRGTSGTTLCPEWQRQWQEGSDEMNEWARNRAIHLPWDSATSPQRYN